MLPKGVTVAEHTDNEGLLKSFRKKALFDIEILPVKLDYGRDAIEKIIPHRPPLLFVDRLVGYDPAEGLMAGKRFMDPQDPVFAGHFPDFPVYPGNFTIETIGQLGLCMYYFVANKRSDIGSDAAPIQLRATKVGGALFVEPILPGDEVTILAKRISFDGYFAAIIGQAMVRGKVAVVTIGEVMIMND